MFTDAIETFQETSYDITLVNFITGYKKNSRELYIHHHLQRSMDCIKRDSEKTVIAVQKSHQLHVLMSLSVYSFTSPIKIFRFPSTISLDKYKNNRFTPQIYYIEV